MSSQEESIVQSLVRHKISRRDFLKFCGLMAATLAMPQSAAAQIEKALAAPKRTPVIWLEL